MSKKTKRNARRRCSFCRSNTTRLIIPAKIQALPGVLPGFFTRSKKPGIFPGSSRGFYRANTPKPAKSPVFCPAAAEVFTEHL